MAASDHLYYEIWMFRESANSLTAGRFENPNEVHLKNALLESFTVHTRVLLEFLYANSPRPDDVIAEDFIQVNDWLGNRPPKSDLLQETHHRVHKELAHLTYARQQVTPETKEWPFAKIVEEVTAALRTFLQLVPASLLGERWKNP